MPDVLDVAGLVAAAYRMFQAGLDGHEATEILVRRTEGLIAVPAVTPPAPPAGKPVGAPVLLDAPAGPTQNGPGRLAPAGLPERADLITSVELPEPRIGAVVTDTRQRVCWRDDAGWHRADTERVLTWAEVVASVGGPEMTPRPGTPVLVSDPPVRTGATVTREGGRLEMVVQRAVLGPDGEPVLDNNGAPRLQPVTESVTIAEIVPAPEDAAGE
jgi:hypothetical protein